MSDRPLIGMAHWRLRAGALAVAAFGVLFAYSRAEDVNAQASPASSVSPQEAQIVQALTALLSDTSSTVREASARALGDRSASARSAVPALMNALADPQRRVRLRAAEALGEIGDPSATERLGDALAADAGRDVARVAAQALGKIGTQEAAAILERSLLSASLRDDDFRSVVVGALARTGQQVAVDRLESLFPVADRRLQQTIMNGFADSGTGPAMNALLRMLQSPDPALKLMAVRALGGK